jgi:peptidoglycan/LPS O-acetylase OafA/YrhL
MMFGAIPVAVICSYIFYLAFEKPFLRNRKSAAKTVTPAEISGADPSPKIVV